MPEDKAARTLSLDMNDSIVVVFFSCTPYVLVYIVAYNYACVDAVGAFDSVHRSPVRSVHILGRDFVMSASEVRTIAISALQSDAVVVRIQLRDHGLSHGTSVLSDGSILILGYYPETARVVSVQFPLSWIRYRKCKAIPSEDKISIKERTNTRQQCAQKPRAKF